MNKRYLLISVFFFIVAVLCLAALFKAKFQSYALTGAIISTFIGLAFLRRAKNPHA